MFQFKYVNFFKQDDRHPHFLSGVDEVKNNTEFMLRDEI